MYFDSCFESCCQGNVTCEHLNYTLPKIFVASHFLSVKVSPERLKVKLLVNSLILFLWLFSFRLVTTCIHLPGD